MTPEPTEAQIKAASDLLRYDAHPDDAKSVAHLIAEHEAFREQVREVAIEVKLLFECYEITGGTYDRVKALTLTAPEPTPAEVLADAVSDVLGSCAALSDEQVAYHIRRILTMRGVELRFKDRSHEG